MLVNRIFNRPPPNTTSSNPKVAPDAKGAVDSFRAILKQFLPTPEASYPGVYRLHRNQPFQQGDSAEIYKWLTPETHLQPKEVCEAMVGIQHLRPGFVPTFDPQSPQDNSFHELLANALKSRLTFKIAWCHFGDFKLTDVGPAGGDAQRLAYDQLTRTLAQHPSIEVTVVGIDTTPLPKAMETVQDKGLPAVLTAKAVVGDGRTMETKLLRIEPAALPVDLKKANIEVVQTATIPGGNDEALKAAKALIDEVDKYEFGEFKDNFVESLRHTTITREDFYYKLMRPLVEKLCGLIRNKVDVDERPSNTQAHSLATGT